MLGSKSFENMYVDAEAYERQSPEEARNYHLHSSAIQIQIISKQTSK